MKSALFVLALCLGSLPFLAHGQASSTTASASASIDIKVEVPPFVEFTETAPAFTDGTNKHEIVVNTSIKGVCVHIVNTRPGMDWSIEVMSSGWRGHRINGDPSSEIVSSGWWGHRINGGYSFCSLEAGKQTLTLQHRLNWSGLTWPFRTTVVTKSAL